MIAQSWVLIILNYIEFLLLMMLLKINLILSIRLFIITLFQKEPNLLVKL